MWKSPWKSRGFSVGKLYDLHMVFFSTSNCTDRRLKSKIFHVDCNIVLSIFIYIYLYLSIFIYIYLYYLYLSPLIISLFKNQTSRMFEPRASSPQALHQYACPLAANTEAAIKSESEHSRAVGWGLPGWVLAESPRCKGEIWLWINTCTYHF